ncbi:DUF1127 domain-containing protein [Marinobacterium rhizophilum]|uniref:DUF1127 domain-containing protein n=1 Tax=Marinobacterium rhizophilum TaxID=420402 RepID=A0ABY5HMV4_9GAMM|nr:DUF1127 domain-containing protein [Marinobacterium rhizophilum]UTW13740.1 DUF1127 domain-containing protein [Marinobacterium rhizophilum]
MLSIELFHRLWESLRRARQRYYQRRQLLGLDDSVLKDIGISRADAFLEGSKHFWQK